MRSEHEQLYEWEKNAKAKALATFGVSTGRAHSIEYDRGEPCAWCGKNEDGGLDCSGAAALNKEGTADG